VKPRKYSSTGIVLARRNYAEADRIVVLFSKDFGKLFVLAKGVRKLKSRKRGSIEIFSHIRFSATKSRGLDFLTEVESIDNFESTRSDIKKVLLAYYFAEVIGRLSQEEKKNDMLFEYFLNTLKKLEKEAKLKKFRHDFIYKVLVISGFWPKGKKIDDADRLLENILERKVSSQRVGKSILL
jgi:DNA repair protein RecO (recombination protein O)